MPRADPTPRVEAAEDDKDWKLFLLSFTAFFTVAYTFIVCTLNSRLGLIVLFR